MSKRAAMNADLAVRVAMWLESNGCVTTIQHRNETYEVYYTLKEDMRPQPPILCDGSVGGSDVS